MKRLKNFDIPLLVISIVLSLFGVVMIFSASSYSAVLQYKVSEYYFASRQLIILAGSFLVSIFVLRFPIKGYRRLYKIFILGIIGALLALKTYGSISHNAQSWINLGFFNLQPSEFAKTAIILYLAFVYGKKKKFNNVYEMMMPLAPCVLIFGLVFIEPDRGTALIIAIICMFIFFTLPFEKEKHINALRNIIIIATAALLVGINFMQGSFKDSETFSRFNFRNPCSRYLEDTGYQVCNGYIAINNGGVLGAGLGKSTQKYLYLPEAHTDFIFAIIVEELGLVVGAVILVLLFTVLYRVLLIARYATDLTGSIIAYGTFAYIFVHICINLGGMLALIPLTGVPLPFLSYGGSFMINLYILLSLTQRVGYETNLQRGRR